MSYAAERWARSQTTGNASAKFVLIELANALNRDDTECYPSIESLESATELNRKTIMASTKLLEERGFIKKRRTFENGKQRIYYSFPNFNPAEWAVSQSTKNGTFESTKNGTLLPQSTENGAFQNPKNGTAESTENGTFESTKNGTVTRNKNREYEQGIDIGEIPPADPDHFASPKTEPVDSKPKAVKAVLKKPDGVPEDLWTEWKAHKRKVSKTCTQRMVDALVREAGIAGIPPERAMTIQLEKGWRGFEAKYLENSARFTGGNRFREKKESERRYELW